MDEDMRKEAEWLWNQLQSLVDKAEKKELNPFLMVWSCLRYASWLNFQRGPSTAAAMTVALDILSSALEEARGLEETDTEDSDSEECGEVPPPGAVLH